jgi:two-component system sensor histidine kinase/response regulator
VKTSFTYLVKLKKWPLLVVFFIMNTVLAQAQNNTVTLLLGQLQSAKQDVEQVSIYKSLSDLYSNKNPDSALLMAERSLDIAQRIKFKEGAANAFVARGKALVALEQYPEALRSHFSGLKISQQLKLDSLTERCYSEIGLLYSAIGNTTKALYYIDQADSLAKSPSGRGEQSYIYLNLGEVYRKKNFYDSAISYNIRALVLERKTKDSLTIAIALYNISDNYIRKHMYTKAMPYLEEAWAISKEIDDFVGIAYCNDALGMIKYYTSDYVSSIHYFEEALAQANQLKMREIKKNCYSYLYLNYIKTGNYKSALDFRNKEIAITDSINNIRKDKEIKNIVIDYQVDLQNDKIALLEKDKQIRDVIIKTDTLKRNLLSLGILLLAALGFFIFKSYLQKNKLSIQLEKQNKEIRNQNLQLEELNNVKTKLFSIVSHDLRGPIGSVKSIMDLIQDNMISADEIKTIIPKLNVTLLQTTHLLDNLLYWAKSQMNGMAINKSDFDINRIVSQSTTLVENRASNKGVNLRLVTEHNSLFVHADEPTIDIVTRNLIENAIKFSSAGDEIIVQTEIKNTEVVVSVRDQGKGIPHADQSKIFNRFATHTTFGTAREKGSGLGLLLCKELVENNKGKIWFTSEPGQGSTFTFSLPASKNAIDANFNSIKKQVFTYA